MAIQYRSSTAPGPASAPRIDLKTIWDARCDAQYDVDHAKSIASSRGAHPRGGTGFIAIRTVSGRGWIDLGAGEQPALPGHLVVTTWDRIRRYHSLGGSWRHWWFEFDLAGPPFFPLHEPLQAAPIAGEAASFAEAFSCIRSPEAPRRALACAAFARLLLGWLVDWRGSSGIHAASIRRAIDRMHERLADNAAMAEFAREARMSERLFRQAFRAETGQSPKSFYDGLRLAAARDWLRLGLCNVSEAAERLGFSSPYHFSRAYRRRMGAPPSSDAQRAKGP